MYKTFITVWLYVPQNLCKLILYIMNKNVAAKEIYKGKPLLGLCAYAGSILNAHLSTDCRILFRILC